MWAHGGTTALQNKVLEKGGRRSLSGSLKRLVETKDQKALGALDENLDGGCVSKTKGS